MLTAEERLVFTRQGRNQAACDAVATSRVEAGVTRAILAIAEWSDSLGRVHVDADEHAQFAYEIAAAIRGVEA